MFNYLKAIKLSFLLLLGITFFTSCDKDGADNNVTPKTEEVTLEKDNSFFLRSNASENENENSEADTLSTECEVLCFDFAYPLDLSIPDGTTKTVNSDEELETVFDKWFEDHPIDEDDLTTEIEIPEIIFPIQVTLEGDGPTVIIENVDALMELIDSCFEQYFDCEDDWEECFTIEFPVTVNLPDGTTVTANNENALNDIYENWIEGNPDSEAFPEIAFPLNVIYSDGTVTTVNSEEELSQIFIDCFGDDFGGEFEEECFSFVFPIEVTLPNAANQTATSEEELYNIIDAWFENSLDSLTDEFPSFIFPIEVALHDGTIQAVNSEEDLDQLLDECYGEEFEECFTPNFPIDLAYPDSSILTVNDYDELFEGIDAWYENNPDSEEDVTVVFPIDVTIYDGTVRTINKEEELDALFEECYGIECEDSEGLFIHNEPQAATRAAMRIKANIAVKKNGLKKGK